MSQPKADLNRLEIRQSIGRNTGDIVVGTTSAIGATTSLLDTYGLQKGGTSEYNGRQIQINELVTSGPAVGEKAFVTAFDASTKTATLAPALTAAIQTGTDYEMWRPPATIEYVNDLINQTISDLFDDYLKDKETHDTFTESEKYEYNCLSGFVGVSQVEYVYSEGTAYTLHTCDAVWDELVDTDVTASVDTTVEKEGSGCLKLVVAAGCAAGDILATDSITSADISECNEIEIWIRSSVALSAGDIQLLLDNTANCASPIETLNIPATTANTWTRHVITLANPESDTAIISIGLKMAVDKGAFTLYADYIKVVDSFGRQYKILPAEFWSITKGTTPYLKLTSDGLSLAGTNTLLRLSGYQKPTLFSDDSTDADVDPTYLIDKVTGELFATSMVSQSMETGARKDKAEYYLGKAASKLKDIRTPIRQGTKWV